MRRKKRTNISNYLVPILGLAVLGFAMSSAASSQPQQVTPDYNMLYHNYLLAQHAVDDLTQDYDKEMAPLQEQLDIALCLLGEEKVQNGMQSEKTYEQIEKDCMALKKNFVQ